MSRTSPTYRLLYFKSAGRAEPIRWIFALKNITYEDHRIEKATEWDKYKPETPWGQVPVLYVNGKPIGQTVAICRFLARKYHLVPQDPDQETLADEIAESTSDITNMAAAVRRAAAEQKADLANTFLTAHLPNYLAKLQSKLTASDSFCCGENVCWVDLYVVTMLEVMAAICGKDCLESGYPKVEQLVSRVRSLTGIREWIQSRSKDIVGSNTTR